MEYKRIFKDGKHIFIGKIGTVIANLASLIILARILTTEEMGKYSLILMILNLALAIGFNWSDASILRHGREEFVKHKKINKSFWARMYIFMPLLFFFIAVSILFAKPIANYIGVGLNLVFFLVLIFVFSGVLNFIMYMYQSTDRMKISGYVLFSQRLLYLICLALIFTGIFKANLTLVLILMNLSFFISIIFNLFFFDFKKIFPYTYNKNYLKKIWSYSWPQLIGFPGLYLVNYVDLFVIKNFLTLGDVGTYGLAYNGILAVFGFIMIVHNIMFPLIIEYRTKKKFNLIKKYFKKIPLFSAIWAILVIIGLIFSKTLIITLFSAKYSGSVQSFNILLLASVFYFIAICLLPIINAFDLILYSQIFSVFKAGINIVADFILVPRMGIIGAAYGTLIAYVIGCICDMVLIFIKRKKIFGEKNG